jgi:hypothetical protein
MALTAQDAYFQHQGIATLDTVLDSGLGFHEISHFVFFDPEAGLGGVIGIGVYPNVGIMFGYCCLSFEGKQHNLRVSRALSPDRWTTRVGPLDYRIESPLERYRLTIGANSTGIAGELVFEATATAGLVDNSHRPAQMQYNQFGRLNGTLTVAGKTFEARDWMAENCRWWMRGPGFAGATVAPPAHSPGLAIWSPLDFGDFKVWIEHNEFPDGSIEIHDAEVIYGDGSKRVKATSLDHDLEFVPGTVLLKGGRLRLNLADGESLDVLLGRPSSILSLMAAGFTGDERYRQGVYRGEEFLDHETWDFQATPPSLDQARFLDHFLVAECEGRRGTGTFELMLANYPRYLVSP